MATMTRSKSQVIRGFLPGQTFQHANDTIVRVSSLYAGPADVNTELLVEMLDERLAHWQRPGDGGGPPVNRAPGYLKPVSNHADQYAFLEPEGEVFYYTWPLTLRCTNRACQKAAVFERLEDWTAYKGNPARCDKCGSPPRAVRLHARAHLRQRRSDARLALQGQGRERRRARPQGRLPERHRARSSPRPGAAGTARATTGSSAACVNRRAAAARGPTSTCSSARSGGSSLRRSASYRSPAARWSSCAPQPERRRSSSAPIWSTSPTTRRRWPTRARTAATPRRSGRR